MQAKIMAFSGIVALSALVACSPVNTNLGPSTSGNVTKQSTPTAYQIDTQTCSTGYRWYDTLAEMCVGMQIPENNANCGETERSDLFAIRCAGQTWNPAATVVKFTHATGNLVTCDISETETATGRITSLHQFSSKMQMPLKFLHSTLIVVHRAVASEFIMAVRVYDLAGNLITQSLSKYAVTPAELTYDFDAGPASYHVSCVGDMVPKAKLPPNNP